MSDTVTVTANDVSDQVTVTASDVSDMVTVAVTTADDLVTVAVSNDQGPVGPAGPQGPAGVGDVTQTWIGLATGAATITGEIAVTSPAPGIRLTYTFAGGVIRYRFIANSGTVDAFYSDAALTTLIVSRYF